MPGVADMTASNTNPAGNPKLKELKRRERSSDTQRTNAGLEIPVPAREQFESLLDTAAKKQPQASSSERG
jgi:hypothetical protein